MPSGLNYTGRFAPSPTGELHAGSLLAALASFLDARSQGGRWLVRMEDLDPPREQAGAADSILHCLEAHGLHWDDSVVYQSQRQQLYQAALDELTQRGLTYPCRCNRQRLKALGVYDGYCRRHPPARGPCATRLQVPADSEGPVEFVDLFQGPQQQLLASEVGDFVIRRKDQLFAYQLAVVVDDIDQRISCVLRGCDLLDSSPRQHYLFQLLGYPPPQMGHLPILVNTDGQKLSKQTFAEPLQPQRASDNLLRALQQLGHSPPAELRGAPCTTLLDWGSRHWCRQRVPRQGQLPTE